MQSEALPALSALRRTSASVSAHRRTSARWQLTDTTQDGWSTRESHQGQQGQDVRSRKARMRNGAEDEDRRSTRRVSGFEALSAPSRTPSPPASILRRGASERDRVSLRARVSVFRNRTDCRRAGQRSR
eukprot:1259878-Rhodomonas_salina.2